MELYNPENVEADLKRIQENVTPHYTERLEAGDIEWFEFKAGYQNMNLFWATVEYLPTKDGARFGPITAHYTILIINGEIKHQR
jgi:hypothetical protein